MDIFYAILALLTGIGIFLGSIGFLSNCLTKNFAHRMRSLFKKVGDRPLVGVGIGASVTATIQSSTAVTVMTVGLVNVGVLTLFQATAIIMGANIGTTLTNLLVALSFLDVKYIFMALAGIGIIMKMAFKNQKVRVVGELMLYLGMLFVGLSLMSDAFKSYEPIRNFFMGLFEAVTFPLFLILLGALFTAIIQSSTASMAIYLTMVVSGILPVQSALFLILGTEFGTCSTALISAIGTNVNAKRAALAHLFYNIFGTVLFAFVLWPLYAYIVPPLQNVFDDVWLVSIFPLFNNVVSVALMVWFIEPFNKLICRIVKEKETEEDKMRNSLRDEKLLQTPALAVEKALTEVYNMAVLSQENLDRAFDAVVDVDMSQSKVIADCEYRIDFLTGELASFFVRASATPLPAQDIKLIGGLHHVINSIERIGDYAVNLARETNYMKQLDLEFLEETKAEFKDIHLKLSSLFELTLVTFKTREIKYFNELSKLHNDISDSINSVRNTHIERLSSGMYSVEVAKSIYTVLASLQRASDHLINVAFSIRSDTGRKTEAFESIKKDQGKRMPHTS